MTDQSSARQDNLKSDGSFEREMKEAVAEHIEAETLGNADASRQCEQEKVPVSESASGHNAYYFMCNFFHGRTSYAACQETIRLHKLGNDNMRPECQSAIDRGVCPAMKMQAREVEAGQALFFTDRRDLIKRLETNVSKAEEFRYGKARSAYGELKTTIPSEEEAERFKSNLKDRNTAAPAKKPSSDVINVDLAGRNLLGDAISNMMENAK